MTSVDSYKIGFDIGILKDISFSRMSKNTYEPGTTSDDGSIEGIKTTFKQVKHSIVNPKKGIKLIEVNETTGRVIIQGSAKVLKDQYKEGINLETFDQVINEYNSTGIIQVDPGDVLTFGEFFTVDISKNMTMDEPVPGYISSLYRLGCNSQYKVDQYRDGGKFVNGVTFRGKQRSFKERLIFYDKEKDIARDKDLRQYSGQYEKVLRAEMNLAQLRRIRHYFSSNNVSTVLSSQVNANYNLFMKVVSKSSNDLLRLFNETEGLELRYIEKLKGRERIIIEYCQMNWDLVDEFLKTKVKGGSITRYRSEYRKVYLSIKDQETPSIEFIDKHIEEIKLKLVA